MRFASLKNWCSHELVLVAAAFIHHNMDKLSRIYPAGSRTDSSNYNPVPMWNAGCQIGTAAVVHGDQRETQRSNRPPASLFLKVALNFQTPSKEMHINQGRFIQNGVCGYILKPEFQRSLSSQFDPNTLSRGPWLKKKTFHVMVSFPKDTWEQTIELNDHICFVLFGGTTGDLSSAVTQTQQGQAQIHRGPPGESGDLRRAGRQRQQGDTLHR